MSLDLPVKVRIDGMSSVQSDLAKMGEEISGSFTNAIKSAAMAWVSFEGVVKAKDFAMEAVKAFDAEAVSIAKMKNQIGYLADGMNKYAGEQANSTRFTKQDLLAATSRLDVYVKNEGQLKKMLKAVENFATYTGTNAESAAALYSRALTNNSDVLGRYHLGIKGAAGSQERMNSIIDQSSKYFGGLADDVAGVGAGPLIQLQHQWEAMQVEVGEKLMPDLLAMGDWFKNGGVESVGEFAKALIDLIDFELKPVLMLSEMLGGKKIELFQTEELIKKAREEKNVNLLFDERARLLKQIDVAQKNAIDHVKHGLKPSDMQPLMDNIQMWKTQAAMLKTAMAEMADKPLFKGKPPPEADETAAAKKLEESLAAQKYYNESLANMAEDETSKELMEEDHKYAELKKKAKAGTTELANIEKGHTNNVAAIMKKAYDKDITTQLETDNKEIKQAKKTADELKKIADKKFQDHVALTAEYIRKSEETAQAGVEMGEQLGSSIGAGIGKGRAGYKIALKGVLDDAISFIEKQAIAAAVSATATLPVTPVSLIWGGLAGAGIAAAAEVAKAEIAKFAGGTVSVPGTGSGDTVPAMLTPGEMVANSSQKDRLLSAIMNGGTTNNNNNASHTYHINNSVTVMGNIDPRAARDFNMSREASDRRLVQQLRRINMAGQNAGVYAR